MQFCSQCGQGNADDSAFCIQCGAPMPGDQRAQSEAADESAQTSHADTPQRPLESASPRPTRPAEFTGTPPPEIPSPAPGVAPPGYAPYHAPVPVDGMAVASLILGIASYFICFFVGAILAIIFGYIARRNISDSHGTLGGEGFATAGIILGFIHLGLVLLTVVIVLIVVLIVGTTSHSGTIVPTLLATTIQI